MNQASVLKRGIKRIRRVFKQILCNPHDYEEMSIPHYYDEPVLFECTKCGKHERWSL